MDSTTLLAISVLSSTLLLLLSLFLGLWIVQRGRRQAQHQWNLVLAAVLKTSNSQTSETVSLLAKLSEDNRSATVALMNAARESLQLQQTAAREMMEMGAQSALRISSQAQSQADKMMVESRAHSASLTSILVTMTKLLGTRDGIAYAQVTAADRPDTGSQPYTTGDEEAAAQRQAQVDAIFDSIPRLGDEDGGTGAGSDLADFGLYQD